MAALPYAHASTLEVQLSAAEPQTSPEAGPDVAGASYPARLAADLDALICLCAGEIDERQTLAGEELRRRWGEHPEAVLWLDGDGARVGDEVAPLAEDAVDRWLLPATSAGLRALRPRKNCRSEELLALASALASLADDPAGSARLRDLLWCGGAGGFTFDLRDEWASQIDAIPERQGARDALDVARAQAVQERTLAFARRRGAEEHQRDTERMDQWAAQLSQVQLQPPVLNALRHACEGGVHLVETVLATLERHPELAAVTTAAELWRFVLDSFEAGGDLRAEEVLGWLQGDEETLLGQTGALADANALGQATASSLHLDGRSVKQLGNLFAGTESHFLRGLANGLLERSSRAAEAELVAQVVKAMGTRDLWRHVDLRDANDATTRAVAHVLKAAEAEASCWADLVGWSSPEVAGWILRSAPPLVISRVEANLKSMLKNRSPQENAPLIQALAEQGSTSALRSLAEALHETRGRGWAGRVVPIICTALMRKGMGAQYLVPLFRDREVDLKMRLLVLRTLEAQPALLAEAVKFQLGELVEPPAIKERLKAARRKLKEG